MGLAGTGFKDKGCAPAGLARASRSRRRGPLGTQGANPLASARSGRDDRRWRGGAGALPRAREAQVSEDPPNHTRIVDGGDQAHPAPATGASQNIDPERPAHESRPGPRARTALHPCAVRTRGRRRHRGRGLRRHAPVLDHARAPAGVGSRYILLRERKTLPSTTAGTHSTARWPASIAACRSPTASCCSASCRTAREAPCPPG